MCFHLSVPHLFILPPSFHLPLILTQTRDIRFNYYAGPVPTTMSQKELLALPSIFIRFNRIDTSCISVSNSLGFSLSSNFLNSSKLGQIVHLYGSFYCQCTGRNHHGFPSLGNALLKIWFHSRQFLLFPFHLFMIELFSPYLATLVFSVDSPSCPTFSTKLF